MNACLVLGDGAQRRTEEAMEYSMRFAIALALTASNLAVVDVSVAGETTAPNAAALVKAFTSKDLPAAEPGKSAWEPANADKGIACTNPGKAGRGRGHAVLSLDGRQLYILTEKMAPAGTVFWQVDTYDCDPKTGNLTCKAALDLPNLPQECSEFMSFTPDGKVLYALDERGVCYYALGRDAEKGTLSILTTGKPDPSMGGAGGPPWARGGKLAFSADGKTGYCLGNRAFGSFTADPATGALSGFSSVGGTWAKLAFDPATGSIFLVGGAKISVFKTLAAGKP